MIFSVFKMTDNVKATYDTIDDVIAVAPRGLSLSKGDFFDYDANFKGSSAALVKGPNGLYPDTDAVSLTNTTGQVGSAWGNMEKDNYIDITKEQTLSMWLFFGETNGDQDKGTADGMAFVLQNDGRKKGAIATTDGSTPATGETMGVWGADSSLATASTIANRAIKNSWALEFDTYANKSTAVGDAFDNMFDTSNSPVINKQHIASNYPAQASSYSKSIGSAAMLQHVQDYGTSNAVKPENGLYLADSPRISKDTRWHHFVVKYTPPTDGSNIGHINYKVNDENLNGTPGPVFGLGYTDINKTVQLDLTKLGMNYNTANKTNNDETNMLRYGFTASTDKNVGNSNMVIFESMPSLVEADTSAKINDVSQANREITSGDNVHGGDKLKFSYTLSYLSGKRTLDNANATINLPDDLDKDLMIYPADSNGNVGKTIYTYSDGTTKSVDIPESAISGTVLSLTSLDSLGTKSGLPISATVQLNGTAQDYGVSVHKVEIATAKFESEFYNGNTSTPSFTVQDTTSKKKMTLTASNPDTTAYIGDDINLKGTMAYDPSDSVNNDDIILSTSVDGGDYVTSSVPSDSASGSFYLPYTAAANDNLTGTNRDLGKGKHTITVFAVDKGNDYNSSNTITYTVNVDSVGLVTTADKTNITATDNSPVELSGTYKHNNDSDLEDAAATVTYKINSGSEKTKTISDANGKFSLDIDPSDLNTGTNTVTVYLTDSALHSSVDEPLTYTINVPTTAPVLSTNNDAITALQSDGNMKLPGNVTYDGSYKFNDSDLTWHMSVDSAVKDSSDIQSTNKNVTESNFTQSFNLADAGITTVSDTPYLVTAYVTDPYGRKSNTVTYKVTLIDRTVSLHPDSKYSFDAINTSEADRIVKRSGTWSLVVDSVKSAWELKASSSEFTKTVDNNVTKLGANLIFTNSSGSSASMMDQPILLDSNEDEDSEIVNVAGAWNADTGILLNVLPNPSSGTYNGTITWDITQSVKK